MIEATCTFIIRRGVAVAVPTQPIAPVTAGEVEEIRRILRQEREDRVTGTA